MRVLFDDLPNFSDHVLVDGAFDPLHAGHLAYLEAAHRLSKGPLLVSVASDEQIRAKGKIPLLPQAQRVAVLESLKIVSAVHAKDRPTEQVLEQLRPQVYIKGADWFGKLPHEQIDVLARYDIPAWYAPTPHDSSTDRLKAWALADADQSLDRLEAVTQAQTAPKPAVFDTEYFTGNWRDGVEAYTWEGRKKAEGRHAKIVKECFEGMCVLDVGCGPGYFVRMLREVGMDAGGIDPSADAVALSNGLADRVVCGDFALLPPKIAHVAICREVLEHVAVAEIPDMIHHLFRVARKFVYITTRFSQASVFDVATEFDVDPTHITLLSQPFLRALCVLNGGTRRRDLEGKLDHMQKGRVLCYEVH